MAGCAWQPGGDSGTKISQNTIEKVLISAENYKKTVFEETVQRKAEWKQTNKNYSD